jgi:benzoylsuccinyl-CoA thiolase BbsB subunit
VESFSAFLSRENTGLLTPPHDDFEGQLGLSTPATFALIAKRRMELFGDTAEDFAQVSVKNHHNGCLNPYAQYQKELTLEEILGSRMICEPITLLQCCPNSDGAAAAILCSMDVARKYAVQPVKVVGSALLSGDYRYAQSDITVSNLGTKTVRMAYEMAGIGPRDLDIIELHDAFAPEEISHYEELGLCALGEGASLVRSGATGVGGKIPVNPSGGLLSLGHPLSASGLRNIVEIVWHLRGQAGDRQTPNARVGLAQMMGGSVASLETGACSVHILAR